MKLGKIEELLVEVRSTVAFAKKKIEKGPDGFLYTKESRGKLRYYERKSGNTGGHYLGNDCSKTLKDLEEKFYYSQLLKTATEEEQELLEVQDKLAKMPDYNSVFLSIPLEKRHLIAPYEYVPKEKKDDVIRIFNKKPVNKELQYVTQNGEHVRSKSELIIADRLKAAGVPYYYEDPLILVDENNRKGAMTPCKYWHPDFRVQNIRTGSNYYWEHFGMLDNPDYRKSCQVKLEEYAKYGYFPGDNLIITFESSEHGINLEYVDCLIERYLR